MTKTAPILELNGQRYDAETGAPLRHDARGSVDGFLPPQTPVSHDSASTSPLTHSPKAMDIHRPSQHHTHHHPVQHSETLMRQAVHRPVDGFKRHTKAMPHTGALVTRTNLDIMPKRSVDYVDPKRLTRAEHVAKSSLVQRFAVLPEPTAAVAPRDGTAYEPAAAPTPHITSRQPSTDVFERALAAASSHKQPYVPAKHKSKKAHRLRHVTSVLASIAAVSLIIGYVGYQNSATIQLRLASSHAGINATLPAWQPSGFHVGTFSYSPGSVTVSYKNPGSDQKFTIAQSSSNWNSDTLLNEFVYPSNESYDTITSGGTTIYTYGKNNATWVNGGIWYKLTSDGSLSTSQIVNIATSMQS